MELNLEATARLFRAGNFLPIIKAWGSAGKRTVSEPQHRVLIANALALAGQSEEAQALAEMDRTCSGRPVVRSYAESALSIVRRHQGNLEAAFEHAQHAVQFAKEARNRERLAWTQLHLFRLLLETEPTANVVGVIPVVRRAVHDAGVGEATAYLHTCVAILEGRTGRVDEALRHCDICDHLLETAPNAWVQSSSLINRGCVAVLRSDFEKARECFRRARECATQNGHAYAAKAADYCLGYVEYCLGHFEKARDTLETALIDELETEPKLNALETLARVYLNLGQFRDTEQTIERLASIVQAQPRLRAAYPVRWLGITRARLMLCRGAAASAVTVLEATEKQANASNDRALKAAVHLELAQAYAACGATAHAAAALFRANENGATAIPELRGRYYFVGGSLALNDLAALGKAMQHRADRVRAWSSIASKRTEVGDTNHGPSTATTESTPETLAHSLAVLCDTADHPRALADEVATIITGLGCAKDCSVVEHRGSLPARHLDKRAVIDIGERNGKTVSLIAAIPDLPAKAVVLADILRLARAAVSLQRYRAQERNQAAVWPSSAIEHDAGAVFLAEEMQSLLATARRIAATTVPVLITGETGTGKEVLARMIHAYSARAGAPFLPFNCSSVPKDMLDAQLFGHRRGAFTGAIDSFPGVIRAAAGGTLFLDEIGETTLDVQPKLLRFLESSEVHPIGEPHPTRVDVRVIAATNADLDALVAAGRFREDLFYRLNIVRLHVPPLRERRVEIPALAHHYLQKHAHEYQKGDLRLAEETMEYLVLYRWPGNVRQLANEMRRLAALAEPGAVLMPEHLSADIAASRRTLPPSERALEATELVVRLDQPLAAAVQHVERAMIQYALKQCGGRLEDTAAMLGLSRKGLYLKRMRFGLDGAEAHAHRADVA